MRIADLNQDIENRQINTFYISFSDLMVLLCVFFVMILGMSRIEKGSFEAIKTGFTGTTKGTLVELQDRLQVVLSNFDDTGIKVRMDKDGLRLDLDTAVLFDTGSALLNFKQMHNLDRLLSEILKTDYQIDVEGHTDDVPLYKIYGEERETNWSLSGKRSASVVHYLLDFGFPDKRLRIVGYGSTTPKVPINKKTGKQLYNARAQNRRVSILIR
ncbi:MAG: OmpA family protein [Bdellovibrionota bacterium]